MGKSQSQDTARVASITIVGNTAQSSREILDSFQTKPATVLRPSLLQGDLQRLIDAYVSDGFIGARIDSVQFIDSGKNEGTEIVVVITEGKPAAVRAIVFEGTRAFSEAQLVSRMALRVGERFIPGQLESDVQLLLTAYEESGYPFTKIVVKKITFAESAEASVVLSVDEGEQVRIAELRVEGNKTTKDFVVIREARLRDAELFRGDLPEKIKRRLERTNLFSSVSVPDLYLTGGGQATLLVRVTEGNPNFFDGVVGYVPAQRPQAEAFFTGLIDVQFRNLLGTGRKLSTKWYRENQHSQELELHYFEPWVASYPVNASLGFFQRKQDSTYVKRAYETNAELMMDEDLTIGVSFSQTNIIPSEGFGKTVIAESRLLSLGGYIRYDSRDDPITPSSGILYRTAYQTGIKKVADNPSIVASTSSTTQRVTLDLSYYLSVIRGQVFSAELHLRNFRTERIEIGDLFRLGGASSVRGYREGQFLASSMVWTNFEYRFLAGERSFFYGFTDVSYIVVPDIPNAGLQSAEITKVGYGIGLRVDSPLGLIGLNLGFGEGDTFSTGKLHMRLMNEF